MTTVTEDLVLIHQNQILTKLGLSLSDIQAPTQKSVPPFITKCIQVIEFEDNLLTKGLYTYSFSNYSVSLVQRRIQIEMHRSLSMEACQENCDYISRHGAHDPCLSYDSKIQTKADIFSEM